ncbi:MAG: hypothetical protein A3F12_06215 [Gammaproteobacteria bacterium RIFCSPHIGHO2_12_FULL_38_14]|nr:MAG: hypothetical protein A3F12_06215 [Gammaproteobacteria bacterium RIFCSPHIGHO2_12_FULL_38_14]
MAIRDIFKFSRKTFLYPSGWIDLEFLKDQNKTIWSILRSLVTAPTPVYEETFEQAMARLGLKEEDIQHSALRFRLYAIFFLVLSLASLIYSIYLLIHYVTLLGFLLGLGVTGLFLAQAFKYDFWAFQIRRRKLGATVQEWKRSILGGAEGRK